MRAVWKALPKFHYNILLRAAESNFYNQQNDAYLVIQPPNLPEPCRPAPVQV